ncbi:MAG: hypothetical protein Q8Q90_02025 [bacterium]|nr:hypothetical protein [bacterium]
MKNAFKQVFVVSSILAIAGATLFCAFFSMSSMDNMLSNQDGIILHTLHAKELTQTITTLISPFSIIFILLAISLIALSFFQKIGQYLQLNILSYSKWKHWSNLCSINIIEPAVRSWLSLFEVSPNFIKPT